MTETVSSTTNNIQVSDEQENAIKGKLADFILWIDTKLGDSDKRKKTGQTLDGLEDFIGAMGPKVVGAVDILKIALNTDGKNLVEKGIKGESGTYFKDELITSVSKQGGMMLAARLMPGNRMASNALGAFLGKAIGGHLAGFINKKLGLPEDKETEQETEEETTLNGKTAEEVQAEVEKQVEAKLKEMGITPESQKETTEEPEAPKYENTKAGMLAAIDDTTQAVLNRDPEGADTVDLRLAGALNTHLREQVGNLKYGEQPPFDPNTLSEKIILVANKVADKNNSLEPDHQTLSELLNRNGVAIQGWKAQPIKAQEQTAEINAPEQKTKTNRPPMSKEALLEKITEMTPENRELWLNKLKTDSSEDLERIYNFSDEALEMLEENSVEDIIIEAEEKKLEAAKALKKKQDIGDAAENAERLETAEEEKKEKELAGGDDWLKKQMEGQEGIVLSAEERQEKEKKTKAELAAHETHEENIKTQTEQFKKDAEKKGLTPEQVNAALNKMLYGATKVEAKLTEDAMNAAKETDKASEETPGVIDKNELSGEALLQEAETAAEKIEAEKEGTNIVLSAEEKAEKQKETETKSALHEAYEARQAEKAALTQSLVEKGENPMVAAALAVQQLKLSVRSEEPVKDVTTVEFSESKSEKVVSDLLKSASDRSLN